MIETSFAALPLAEPIQRALIAKGYTHMSPIQAQAIPVLLENRDLLACAQTGTGKTAAFALPLLNRLAQKTKPVPREEVLNLVLTPTRELAVQVAESFATYGKFMKISVGLVHGGVSPLPQIRMLEKGLDVLVATPGRLLDLYNQGHVSLASVQCLVLDEADRMLDMGFIHDIRKITKILPFNRQNLLFSATMNPEITKLTATILRNPVEIRVTPEVTTATKVTQSIHFVNRESKLPLLLQLVKRQAATRNGDLSLVFSRTKHGANRLAAQLNKAGIQADAIHGNKSQSARQHALNRFKAGSTPVLVATDVAARGIDVRNITLVVNYDMPVEPESYVHRIGRTARAEASGRAVSFCSNEELDLLRSIERFIKQSVPVDTHHEHHDAVVAERHHQKNLGHNSHRSGNAPTSRPAPKGKGIATKRNRKRPSMLSRSI